MLLERETVTLYHRTFESIRLPAGTVLSPLLPRHILNRSLTSFYAAAYTRTFRTGFLRHSLGETTSEAPTVLFSPSSSERDTPCPSPTSQSSSRNKRRATVKRKRKLDTNNNVGQDAQPRARLTAEEKLNFISDTLRATIGHVRIL